MKKTGNIVKGAIEGSKAVYLILFGLIAVGIVGMWKMNKDEFPIVEIKQGLVAAIYPGASASQVEQELAKPLEEVLLSCPEVSRNKLKSVSKDGICYIYVELNVSGPKIRQTWTDIRFKFQTRKLTLPPNVLAIVVLDDFSSITSLLISLESDDKGWSEMSEYARSLKEKLLAYKDVARVNILGEQTEEIAVTVDMDRLAAYGVDPTLLNMTYTAEGFKVPSGTFSTDYTESRIYIRQNISSEDEIANQIVFNDPTGGIVRLGDIADVERRVSEKTSAIKYNGNNTLLVSVSMRNDRDIVAFGSHIDKILEEFRDELPESVHMERITDQPKVVRTSVLNFIRDLFISILVVILVMLMLFPFKSAMVASTGVPACTAVAIAIMFFLGMPLNTVSLAGLIVVLGMIVDDSIVTMDGYMDKISKGMGRTEAAVEAANELFTPMLMATLSISLMLFPMLFILDSYLKDVFGLFPWVIAITLMISLAYAVFVVPSLEVRYIAGPQEYGSETKGFAKLQAAFFNAIQKVYDKGEAFCFRHPALTIASGVLLVALSGWLLTKTDLQLLPKASRDMFVIEMYLDEGSGLKQTQKNADILTAKLLEEPRVKNVTTFVGTSAPRFHATYAPSLPQKNFAQFIINTTGEKATIELIEEYEQTLEHYFPNAILRIKQMDYHGVSSPVEIQFSAKDRESLIPLADSLAAFMRSQSDAMKWVHTDYANIPAVNVGMNDDETSRLGINPVMLALSMNQEFGSSPLLSLQEGEGSAIPVVLYSTNSSDTVSYDALGNKTVRTAVPTVRVPLRQVADITPDWVLNQNIRTEGIYKTISVGADTKNGYTQPEAMRRIRRWMKENMNELPEGVTIHEGGLTQVNRELLPQMGASFLAAMVVMFVFLLINFKKVNIPIMTMLLSSLCLFGTLLGLRIFNLDFGMTALLGLISLIGIIVRNGIIMFEYAEELHFEQGLTYREAAFLAGSRRMRPIFLTSCTTALGVLPMIISGDALWMPMGVVILFGVMITLPFTVLIMPVSYWQLFAKKDKQS